MAKPRFRGLIAPRDCRSGRPLGNWRADAATGREVDGMAKKQSSAISDQPAISSDGGSPSPVAAATVLRPSAETLYANELRTLAEVDRDPRPPGWTLSPRAVRSFLCGGERPPIRRKFYGDDSMVERAIVSLSSNRGLMLVGEPGTAKSMLSELLAAAISGTSINAIQGTAGTTEDHIKYSWNYALLLAEGPSLRALVASPLYVAMRDELLVRFEGITRFPPEIQDTLVSILSEKVMIVPELDGPDWVLHARPGFNVIGTANTRDRGVHEMSSALKRRFKVPGSSRARLAYVWGGRALRAVAARSDSAIPSGVFSRSGSRKGDAARINN